MLSSPQSEATMPVPCNRANCAFCAGDTTQLYCEGCHAPLGPFEVGAATICEECFKARVRTLAKGQRCFCPPSQRREVVVTTPEYETLECARCAGLIRRIR